MTDRVVLTVHLNRNISQKDVDKIMTGISMLRGVKAVGDGNRFEVTGPNKKRAVPFRDVARSILGFLNEKQRKNYDLVDSHLQLIGDRIKEAVQIYGTTEKAALLARRVIINQCELWGKDPKMNPYLRPATLFGKSKFWEYVGALPEALKVTKEGDNGALL